MKSKSTEQISPKSSAEVAVEVQHLDLRYGTRPIINDVNFQVNAGEIFAIIGGSGCGKSTLLKYLIGLHDAPEKKIFIYGKDVQSEEESIRQSAREEFGVLYQGAALWSSMTLAENVALPLERFRTGFLPEEIQAITELKLALVGLHGFEDFFPSEISGGMAKRAGIARAMALDPRILFFDEPSAGLDPVTSRQLDELILEIRNSLGTTIVLVTHELQSIFAIADRVMFLDGATKSVLEIGDPRVLATRSPHESVRRFLNPQGQGSSRFSTEAHSKSATPQAAAKNTLQSEEIVI